MNARLCEFDERPDGEPDCLRRLPLTRVERRAVNEWHGFKRETSERALSLDDIWTGRPSLMRHILRKLPTVTSTRVQGALKQPTQPR
ncbi:hypothetical protein EVAR_99002_1 [Eumeta japonica]|uniref:Uncharacterized protein n=1 Tax=Eumeta variegata TaxID=151549 RepID=A0A4C1Y1Q4_EUMVA|nr:hypothetical protein EVAR_99002_1 [Eumeta japonica]